MSNHGLIRKDHLILIAVISTLVIASTSISNYGYFGTNVYANATHLTLMATIFVFVV